MLLLNASNERGAQTKGGQSGGELGWTGASPPPSSIDNNSGRYFDQEWLNKATEIVKSKRGDLEGGDIGRDKI